MRLSGFVDGASRRRFAALYAEVMAQRWPAHSRTTVPTSYGVTVTYRAGPASGTPVVLLPGASGTAASWAPLLPTLCEHRPVVAIDVLGEPGDSVQSAAIPDAAARAHWLDEVLGGLGLGRVHLVGLSAGAAIALSQAVHRPQRLVSVAALEPVRALAPLRAGFWARLGLALITRSPRQALGFLRWCRRGREPGQPIRELLIAGLLEHRARVVPPPPHLPDRMLRSVRTPVLVLLGARSPVHDVRQAGDRAALIPGVETHVVDGAAHGLFTEDLDTVSRLLNAFLDRVESPRDEPGPRARIERGDG